ARDLVAGMSGQRARERALARPVRAHDGVHLARIDRQVDAFQYFLALNADSKALYLKQHMFPSALGSRLSAAYPTDPSRLIESSFCASTANSIGSSRKTSLQKPLTI